MFFLACASTCYPSVCRRRRLVKLYVQFQYIRCFIATYNLLALLVVVYGEVRAGGERDKGVRSGAALSKDMSKE